MVPIKIDLNNPDLQKDLFSLEKSELVAFIKTLKKISKISWIALYQDHGLKWEAILSKKTLKGEPIYSFRFSKKYRVTALREGDFLRLLALHVDHVAPTSES